MPIGAMLERAEVHQGQGCARLFQEHIRRRLAETLGALPRGSRHTLTSAQLVQASHTHHTMGALGVTLLFRTLFLVTLSLQESEPAYPCVQSMPPERILSPLDTLAPLHPGSNSCAEVQHPRGFWECLGCFPPLRA
jgi:hypothetical protein